MVICSTRPSIKLPLASLNRVTREDIGLKIKKPQLALMETDRVWRLFTSLSHPSGFYRNLQESKSLRFKK
jgi:hypothetical protein